MQSDRIQQKEIRPRLGWHKEGCEDAGESGDHVTWAGVPCCKESPPCCGESRLPACTHLRIQQAALTLSAPLFTKPS